MDFPEFPNFPSLELPEAPTMPDPVLEVPRAQIPSYKPLVVPPSDLRPPPGVKGETKEEEPKEVVIPPAAKLPTDIRKVDIPYTDVEVPLPSNEILVTAGTTATVSVAATLTATAVFKWTVNAMKPILKTAWTKITKGRVHQIHRPRLVSRTLTASYAGWMEKMDPTYVASILSGTLATFFNYTQKKRMKKLLLFLFLATPAAAQIEPNFTQGSMQQTTNTTQTINEQVVTEIYGGDYSYYSGSNVTPSGNITDPNTTFSVTNAGQQFHVEQVTRAAGLIETTTIDRDITTTSVTTSLSVFSQ